MCTSTGVLSAWSAVHEVGLWRQVTGGVTGRREQSAQRVVFTHIK